jgi:hypothetical protein
LQVLDCAAALVHGKADVIELSAPMNALTLRLDADPAQAIRSLLGQLDGTAWHGRCSW